MTKYSTLLNTTDGMLIGTTGDNLGNSKAAFAPAQSATPPVAGVNLPSDYGMVVLMNVQAFQGTGSIYFRLPVNSGGDPSSGFTYTGCQLVDVVVDVENTLAATGLTVNGYLVVDPTNVSGTPANNQLQLFAYANATAIAAGTRLNISSPWSSTTAVQYVQNTCFSTVYRYLRLDVTNASASAGGGAWIHYTLRYAMRYFYG